MHGGELRRYCVKCLAVIRPARPARGVLHTTRHTPDDVSGRRASRCGGHVADAMHHVRRVDESRPVEHAFLDVTGRTCRDSRLVARVLCAGPHPSPGHDLGHPPCDLRHRERLLIMGPRISALTSPLLCSFSHIRVLSWPCFAAPSFFTPPPESASHRIQHA